MEESIREIRITQEALVTLSNVYNINALRLLDAYNAVDIVVLRPEQIITADYREDRVKIYVDETNKIFKIARG